MNMIMSRPIQQQQQQQQHHHLHRFPPAASPLTPSSPLDFTDRIPFEEIRLSNETLGSGSYGTVFKGRWRGRHVAVKQFKTREEIDSFLVEVKQLSCVKHPNIVTLYGASSSIDTAYLIMEYAEGGSLNHLLHECKQQEYDLRHACSWAMQTARGVAYLHNLRPKPIMHRDLKPANLLLFNRGKILKICDFGTACAVRTQMTNNTGSASYMAPEVFATSSYLESGDVFSWSIIFWEILARRQPYSQQYSNPYQILWLVKQEGVRPSELENCPKIIWELITRSWHKDPKMRPSMREVADQMELIASLAEKSSPSCKSGTQAQLLPSYQMCFLAAKTAPGIRTTNTTLDRYPQSQPFHSPSTYGTTNCNSLSSKSTQCSTNAKRELSNRTKALLYRLEMLRCRASELEESHSSDIKKKDFLFEEYQQLKRQTEFKKQQLRSIQSSCCQSFNGNL